MYHPNNLLYVAGKNEFGAHKHDLDFAQRWQRKQRMKERIYTASKKEEI